MGNIFVLMGVKKSKSPCVEVHRYIVGVYSTKEKAKSAAKIEDHYRDGKYDFSVTEWDIDTLEQSHRSWEVISYDR